MTSSHLSSHGRILACLGAAWLAFGGPAVHAAAPDSVLIFGDSAADQGNLNATPGYEPGPNAPYYRGSDGLLRLSDGPMWTERLYPALRSINGPGDLGANINFAYGAATTGENTFGAGPEGELPVGVQSQVAAYLALREAGVIPAPGKNTYAFIEAGPNDYFAGLDAGDDLADIAAASPARLADSARKLVKAGVSTVFVTETPDFGEAPLFIEAGLPQEVRDQLAAIAGVSRTNLRAELTKVQKEAGDAARVVVMPVNHLFRAVLAQPAAFGFTNVQGRIYDDENDVVLETDASKQVGYLFVDSLHLAARGQAWQARYYAEVIGAIDGTVQQRFARLTDGLRHDADLMSAAGLDAIAGPADADRWTWFATARGGLGWGGYEPQDGPDWQSGAAGALVGARRLVTPKWTLGLALGAFAERGKTGDRALRWRNHGEGLWFLNEWKLDPVTVRFTLGGAYLDTATTRDPSIPTFVARGDSSGYLVASRFEVERRLGQLTSAIEASVLLGSTISRSHVKAFDESGAAGLNVRLGRIERDSLRSDVGVRFRATEFRVGSVKLQPSADLLFVYEGEDRTTDVTAQLLENSAAPVTTTVSNGRTAQGAVRFNLGIALTEQWHAQISDTIESRSSHQHEHRVQVGVMANF